MIVELKFDNIDAEPRVVIVHVDNDDCSLVMQWYGAMHAGDRYKVFQDGQPVPIDRNGRPL